MALRQLAMVYSGLFELHDASLHLELNKLFGMEPLNDRETCDTLLKIVKDKLAQHEIVDPVPRPELNFRLPCSVPGDTTAESKRTAPKRSV